MKLTATQYHLILFTGIHWKSVKGLQFGRYGVKFVPYRSGVFGSIKRQLNNPDQILQDLEKEMQAFNIDDFSFLLISDDYKKVQKAFHFLALLQPSRLTLIAEFDCKKIDLDIGYPKPYYLQSITYGGINVTNVLYEFLEKSDGDLLAFFTEELTLANRLLNKYMTIKHSNEFINLLGIYMEAFAEEKSYVKYTFFWMIIESMVISDSTSGVVYKLSRMCATLIGDNSAFSEKVEQRIKKSYDVRSKLLHSAKNTIHDGNYMKIVQAAVCELLINFILSDFTIKDFFAVGHRMGFGERKRIIRDKKLMGYQTFLFNQFHLSIFSANYVKGRKKELG